MTTRREIRKYDVIIIGATGYTGTFTAEYIALNLPSDLRWAIAGRSRSKLDALAKRLGDLSPDHAQPAIEVVSLDDQKQIDTLVGNAKVCISVVTYWKGAVGETIVQACINKKTDYLDVAGDVPLLKSWITKYHKAAESAGVALIHVCGTIAAISDILTWTAARELRAFASLKTKEAILSVKEFDNNASAGTLESVLHHFSLDREVLEDSEKPWALSPVEGTKKTTSASTTNLFGLRRDPDLGLLAASAVSASANRAVVHRTWGLLRDRAITTTSATSVSSAAADSDYGPNFQYNEYQQASSVLSGFLATLSHRLFVAALSLAPLRALAARWFLPAPGQGPNPEETKNLRIAMELVAAPDITVEGGTSTPTPASTPRARSVFSYPGGSYHVTALVLVQGAMSLLHRNARELEGGYAGGCLTPAFLGEDFVRRVRAAGAVLRTEIID